MLPDATQFLAAFEGALHRLAASRPQLAAWLRWIDEQAGMSQAGYSRPATRLFLTTDALGFDLARDLDPALARDRDRALAFGLARDLATISPAGAP